MSIRRKMSIVFVLENNVTNEKRNPTEVQYYCRAIFIYYTNIKLTRSFAQGK